MCIRDRHGGKEGFHARLFAAEIQGDTLIMQYFSRDMEEGYPGNVSFRVSFVLCEDTLSVQYQAVSDKDKMCIRDREILCSRMQMELKPMIAHVMSEGMKTLIHVNEMLKED